MATYADVQNMMTAMETYIHSIQVRRDTDRFGGEVITDDELQASKVVLFNTLATLFNATP